jgi:hypothetical protein
MERSGCSAAELELPVSKPALGDTEEDDNHLNNEEDINSDGGSEEL